jgi:hypothetical protein
MIKKLSCALVAAGLILAPAGAAIAQSGVMPTTRDGRHDFDFMFGTWRTHYRILAHRLAGSHEWYACEGTSVIRPFWGTSGNLEDGDLQCPKRYIGGLTLRVYNAGTHQWSLWWGTRKLGVVPPPQVGHFDAGGVGDFYAPDVQEGKRVIVRFQWTHPNGIPHFEQAFSTDNGRTWETNWTTDYERVPATTKGTWNATE